MPWSWTFFSFQCNAVTSPPSHLLQCIYCRLGFPNCIFRNALNDRVHLFLSYFWVEVTSLFLFSLSLSKYRALSAHSFDRKEVLRMCQLLYCINGFTWKSQHRVYTCNRVSVRANVCICDACLCACMASFVSAFVYTLEKHKNEDNILSPPVY